MKQIHFDIIDSTNTYLKNNYKKLDNYTFVSANSQNCGKGRNNRKWDSNDDNLLFSLLIKDKELLSKTNTISILSAYIVLKTLQEYGIGNISIKWPNDVYVKDKKICGILLESISYSELECLIIGVGINVNQISFNKEYNATSMINELGKHIDVVKMKNDIYSKFIEYLNKLNNNYDYYKEIIKYDYLKNKEVYALISGERRLVKVKGINLDYSLCVSTNDSEFNLHSGEISFHI